MASSSALQALAVLTAAVAFQQYSSRRSQKLAAHQVAKTAAAAADAQRKKKEAVPASDRSEAFVVEIEYCTGCRWMLRAAWLAQELLTTFQDDLHSVKLTPNSRQGGVFQVYVYDENSCDLRSGSGSEDEKELLWSRKAAGRFPESKELKQIVRDFIRPDKGLGHSDKK